MLESFPSDSGMLRISWKTDASALEAPRGFRVILHSAISGRPIVVAVDEKAAGSVTAFVGDEPRMYFVSIEAQGLDWSLTVEERIY
jgi:hypothetical protein